MGLAVGNQRSIALKPFLTLAEFKYSEETHLLLVLPLCHKASLNAVPRLEEGSSLRQLARVVSHDAGQVAGQKSCSGA